MMDFETFYKNHGEDLIWDVLHIWERDNKIQHPPMTLEDRWTYFVHATDNRQGSVHLSAASTSN